MTREEAIEALEIELNKWKADCKSYHAVKEALPMAIKALKNENAVVDRVLEIIDEEIYLDEKIMLMEEDESIAECISRSIDSMDIIRRRVVVEIGGEHG